MVDRKTQVFHQNQFENVSPKIFEPDVLIVRTPLLHEFAVFKKFKLLTRNP